VSKHVGKSAREIVAAIVSIRKSEFETYRPSADSGINYRCSRLGARVAKELYSALDQQGQAAVRKELPATDPLMRFLKEESCLNQVSTFNFFWPHTWDEKERARGYWNPRPESRFRYADDWE
jgi:hypothetical protein